MSLNLNIEIVDAVQRSLESDGTLQSIRNQIRVKVAGLISSSAPSSALAKDSSNTSKIQSEFSRSENGKIALLLVKDLLKALELRKTLGAFEEEINFGTIPERSTDSLKLSDHSQHTILLEKLVQIRLDVVDDSQGTSSGGDYKKESLPSLSVGANSNSSRIGDFMSKQVPSDAPSSSDSSPSSVKVPSFLSNSESKYDEYSSKSSDKGAKSKNDEDIEEIEKSIEEYNSDASNDNDVSFSATKETPKMSENAADKKDADFHNDSKPYDKSSTYSPSGSPYSSHLKEETGAPALADTKEDSQNLPCDENNDVGPEFDESSDDDDYQFPKKSPSNAASTNRTSVLNPSVHAPSTKVDVKSSLGESDKDEKGGMGDDR